MLEKNFKDIISNIKEEIINTQIKTMQEVNSNLIMLYFKLGKIVSENKQYGNNFTKQVSTELKLTFPNMKGFSERNIRSMRLFYEEYADDEDDADDDAFDFEKPESVAVDDVNDDDME